MNSKNYSHLGFLNNLKKSKQIYKNSQQKKDSTFYMAELESILTTKDYKVILDKIAVLEEKHKEFINDFDYNKFLFNFLKLTLINFGELDISASSNIDVKNLVLEILKVSIEEEMNCSRDEEMS